MPFGLGSMAVAYILKSDIMDKKMVGIAIVVVIIVVALGAFLAFSGNGGSPAEILSGNSTSDNGTSDASVSEVKNKTFDFAYCSLELPEDTEIVNLTNNESGFEAITYLIFSNSTNESFMMAVASGDNLIPSTDSYVENMASQGNPVEKVKDYKDWVIVKNNETGSYQYQAVHIEGGHGFIISHEDVGSLEKIVDVYKFKG